MDFKKLCFGVAAATLLLGAAACTEAPPSSDNHVAQTVEQQQDALDKVLPVPVFNWSEPRNDLIQIYTAVTQAHDTWTVFEANNGTSIDVCPSKGFPIPVTTELTNPSYVAHTPYPNADGYSTDVLPQPEPTGLWTGNTQGTWVLCVQADGSVEPVYSEPNVMTFAHPVRVVNGQIQDVPGASGTIKINIGQK